MMQEIGEKLGLSQPVFFKPNTEMVKWLLEYAGDRLIIDAGCGEKFLLSQQLYRNGGKQIVAIDPYIDYSELMKLRITNERFGIDNSFHIMVGTIEQYKTLIQNKSKDVLIIFARPCHSEWVENTLDLKSENVEALYITLPENIEKYDDLGKWKEKAVLLQHKGSSADKEVVYSINERV